MKIIEIDKNLSKNQEKGVAQAGENALDNSKRDTIDIPENSPEDIELVNRIVNAKYEAKLQRDKQIAAWDTNLIAFAGNKAVIFGMVPAIGALLTAGTGPDTTLGVGLFPYTANRIKNVCMNKTAQLVAQDPTVHISPRCPHESNAPYCIQPNAGFRILLEMKTYAKAGAPNPPHIINVLETLGENYTLALSGDITITNNQYQELVVLMNEEKEPVFQVEDFICVNDIVESDILENTLQAVWERSSFSNAIKELGLAAIVIGWAPIIVQWDESYDKFNFINCNPKNTYCDPVVEDFHQSHYYIYDQVMSLDEAISLYPEHESALRKNAFEGQVQSGVGGAFPPGNIYLGTVFIRPMVVVSTAWLRYSLFPMTEEEAIKKNKVIIDEEGNYTLLDGKETKPSGRNWPKRTGVLEVKMLNKYLLEKNECDYSDAPIFAMVNIPIPTSPFGQGEPEQLTEIQAAINTAVTAIANNLLFAQTNQVIIPAEVNQALGPKAKLFLTPGEMPIIPDILWEKYGGKVFGQIEAPKLPEGTPQNLQLLNNIFDQLSGMNDVQRGQPSPDAESGKAIEALQQSGSVTINYIAKSLEQVLTRMASVCLNCLLERLPLEDWESYNSKYPKGVVSAVLTHSQNIDHFISVETSAGKGVSKTRFRQLLLQLAQMGKISTGTLLEHMDIPGADSEMARMAEEQVTTQKIITDAQRRAQTQSQPQGQPPQGVAPQGEQTPPQIIKPPEIKNISGYQTGT